MGETILSVRPPRLATQSPIIVLGKKKRKRKKEIPLK